MLQTTSEASALDDVRILDLTGEDGAYCTRLLADLGADVIRVEPPGGSAIRARAPFVGDEPGSENGIVHLYLNASKRGVTIDLEMEAGREVFRRLVTTSDIVVESFKPGYMASLGLGYEDLEKIKPGIIVTSITGFGQDGPHSQYDWSDLVCVAMGAILNLSGFVDLPPYRPYPAQAYYCAGVTAATGTLLALTHRDIHGEGQAVDVSIQESLSMAQETAMQAWDFLKRNRRRTGGAETVVRLGGLNEVADGYVFAMIGLGGAGAPLYKFVEWMADSGFAKELVESGALDDLREVATAGRGAARDPAVLQRMQGHMATVGQEAQRFLKSKPKQEVYEQGQGLGFLVGPANDARDIVENEQLNARGWFVDVPHPELGKDIKFPGFPYHLSDSPARIRRRAPLVGEHNAEVFAELGLGLSDLDRLKGEGAI